MLRVFERAGGTPLSALQRYFPECSARADSSLNDPFVNTTGSDTLPNAVSVLPLNYINLIIKHTKYNK